MKRHKIFQIALSSLIIVFYMSSCSTTSNLPYDDVYYSAKKSSSKAPNQSNLSNDVYESSSSTGDYQSYYNGETSTATDVAVGAGAYGNDYNSGDENYSEEDIYYDSDYESRINRFNDDGSTMGYYDDYYTGGDGCNCSGSSNWSMSIGIGMGYGWGMSYGYGWPYYGYPYYGWGYPYYGYPYYGWGYPYYGYPYYGGGYYPDYGYGNGYASTYRPRGSHGGGTNVPRTGSRGSSGVSNPSYNEKKVVAGGGGTYSSRSDGAYTAGGGTIGNSNQNVSSRPAESVRVKPETLPSKTVPDNSSSQRIEKPRSQGQVQNQQATRSQTYRKPTQSNRSSVSQKPRYEKPKSYRTLPEQQTRSSKEYVAPKKSNQPTRQQPNSNARTNTRKPLNQPKSNYNRNTNTRSNVNRSTPANKNNTRTRSTTTRSTTKSSTPSRSKSTPSRSYSSPSRSYSSPSRSYSSPSRSSSSSGSSRSSGRSSGGSSSSSSRSSGGRR